MNLKFFLKITFFMLIITCNYAQKIIVGAERPNEYLHLLQNKKIGIVTNQTGMINFSNDFDCPKEYLATNEKCTDKESIHIVDFLFKSKIQIIRIFAPEHGFRGTADAGEHIQNGIDSKTNLPIISLYGSNRKPTKEQIQDLDIILFDVQDVGTRFYTYISTLHNVLEAAAQYGNKKVIVLDRPNPNGHYIDGPILEKTHTSFVGMHPVPVVYGMTIGEYAKMINGEKWLENGIQADLTVIPLKNYTHKDPYSLPIKPSPNLPNDSSINLYPSTCFFEGTNLSEGRGTSMQFQIYGSPFQKITDFKFTPKPNEGAKEPKYNGQICYGRDLRKTPKLNKIDLSFIIEAYKNNTKQPFFNTNLFFDKLAGNTTLRNQIEKGLSEKQIKETWVKGLSEFKKIRKKYLIYK